MQATVLKPFHAVEGADWYREMLQGETLPASVDAEEAITNATAALVNIVTGASVALACSVATPNANFTIAGQQAGNDYWVVVKFTNAGGKVWPAQIYIHCPAFPVLS